jgi:hypothetical protein
MPDLMHDTPAAHPAESATWDEPISEQEIQREIERQAGPAH